MNFKKITILAVLMMITLGAAAQTKGNDKATKYLTTTEFKEKVYDYKSNPESFEYKGTLPAIVDFYATWCRPCQALSPVLEELAKEYEGKIIIYKVDIDKEPELSRIFGITSIPTLLFIQKDGEASLSVGAPGKEELKRIIEDMIRQ